MPNSSAKHLDLVWKIGGEAGNGIMVIGSIFARAVTRAGFSVFDYQEYPSLIRGGHNVYQVRFSTKPIHAQAPWTNVLVALNRETIDLHIEEVRSGGIVLHDGNEVPIDTHHIKPGIKYVNVPFLQIARDVAGERLMMNTVALGASARAIGMDFLLLAGVIADMFKDKGPKVVSLDLKCAKAGYDYVEKHYSEQSYAPLPKNKTKKQVLLNGVEAMAMGAIKAGMNFYAAYPMTPSSGFLSFFAEHAERYNMVVKQTEDEIAAINMAVGAGYAGVRSMVATSGGGFSLMVEGVGLAGMTETPVVIIEGMRGGPSTGLPTWTEQADLLFVRHASQGDFPRLVVAPGDIEEAFYLTAEAFNWAEQFQLPVIILSDKYLAESHTGVNEFDTKKIKILRGEYIDDRGMSTDTSAPRYAVTHSGVSPRMLPGIHKVIFNVSSDEHDELGDINEEIDNRIAQMNKRMKKLSELASLLPRPTLYGPAKAEMTLIGWGSVKGAVLDALELLLAQGITTNFLHLTYMHPFPATAVKDILKNSKHTMMIEGNYSGQGEALLKQETLHSPDFHLRKYDGRPFYADEIADYVRQTLHSQSHQK